MATKKEKVIPIEYIPDVGSQILTIDKKNYLIANDAMYTFYQRSKGEFSDFFMLSTPPITYFANSLFLKMAPYGRGRVVLKGADTALSVNVYTTTGILAPGLIKKGTEVKVVFRKDRIGEISDIFCIPTSELTKTQIAKKGLLEMAALGRVHR